MATFEENLERAIKGLSLFDGAPAEYFCPIFDHMKETLPSPGDGWIFLQSRDGEITIKGVDK